jgi:hypothetical protein
MRFNMLYSSDFQFPAPLGCVILYYRKEYGDIALHCTYRLVRWFFDRSNCSPLRAGGLSSS